MNLWKSLILINFLKFTNMSKIKYIRDKMIERIFRKKWKKFNKLIKRLLIPPMQHQKIVKVDMKMVKLK